LHGAFVLQDCLIARSLDASIAAPRVHLFGFVWLTGVDDGLSVLFASGEARTTAGQRYLIAVAEVMAVGICCDGAL
jgi:hypothetical protein